MRPRLLAHSYLRAFVGQGRCFSVSSTSSASTNAGVSSDFPFPTHPNPTPWEIFHLPTNATPAQVKARYYELVKIHHPDTNHPDSKSVPHDLKHKQFQSITAAYNILRGSGRPAVWSSRSPTEDEMNNEILRRSSYTNNRRWTGKRNQWGGFIYEDESPGPTMGPRKKAFRKEDLPFWIFTIVAVGGALFHFVMASPAHEALRSHVAAKHNLDRAQSERALHGSYRREEMKKYLEYRKSQAEATGQDPVVQHTEDSVNRA